MRAGSFTEFRVGGPGLLEVHDVEEVLGEHETHRLDRRTVTAGEERHAHPDDAGEALAVQERGLPGDHRSPVVPDDHGPLRVDVVEQADQVAGEGDDVVVLDRFRA